MNVSTETIPRKRGRPFGTLGPRGRQKQLASELIQALGGESNITPLVEMDIMRAVVLTSFAEESRRQITKYGARSVAELQTLVRLEECAERAVKKLKLPTATSL